MSYAFFWVIPRRLTPVNRPKESIQQTGWILFAIITKQDYGFCISNKLVTYEGWNFNSGNYLFTTDTK